jgi:hypothetical protein
MLKISILAFIGKLVVLASSNHADQFGDLFGGCSRIDRFAIAGDLDRIQPRRDHVD